MKCFNNVIEKAIDCLNQYFKKTKVNHLKNSGSSILYGGAFYMVEKNIVSSRIIRESWRILIS
jgi:hypothetical protein